MNSFGLLCLASFFCSFDHSLSAVAEDSSLKCITEHFGQFHIKNLLDETLHTINAADSEKMYAYTQCIKENPACASLVIKIDTIIYALELKRRAFWGGFFVDRLMSAKEYPLEFLKEITTSTFFAEPQNSADALVYVKSLEKKYQGKIMYWANFEQNRSKGESIHTALEKLYEAEKKFSLQEIPTKI